MIYIPICLQVWRFKDQLIHPSIWTQICAFMNALIHSCIYFQNYRSKYAFICHTFENVSVPHACIDSCVLLSIFSGFKHALVNPSIRLQICAFMYTLIHLWIFWQICRFKYALTHSSIWIKIFIFRIAMTYTSIFWII